jgi:uncharacterized protein YjbK
MSTINSKSKTNKGTFVVQHYDYFMVLDFEATCDVEKRIKPQVINIFSSLFTKYTIVHADNDVSKNNLIKTDYLFLNLNKGNY